MKKFIKEVKPYCNLYIDEKTGIAWIEDGSTGMGRSVHPNIDITGSVRGMKERGYWDKDDKIVRSHGWQYNISKFVASDELDWIVAKQCNCEKCIERRKYHIALIEECRKQIDDIYKNGNDRVNDQAQIEILQSKIEEYEKYA